MFQRGSSVADVSLEQPTHRSTERDEEGSKPGIDSARNPLKLDSDKALWLSLGDVEKGS